MTAEEIYSLWLSKFKDRRYLRLRRWRHLRNFIQKNNIKSVIEFGSGVSTLLFDNLNLDILSLDTNKFYMSRVCSLCSPKVRFKLWDNKTLVLQEFFDLSLVDGILPRDYQLECAVKLSKFISVDDYILNVDDRMDSLLSNHERVDIKSAPLGLFISKDEK